MLNGFDITPVPVTEEIAITEGSGKGRAATFLNHLKEGVAFRGGGDGVRDDQAAGRRRKS